MPARRPEPSKACRGSTGIGTAPSSRDNAQNQASLLPWLESHLSELDALVLDIDGLLVVGGRATAGAQALLRLLGLRGIPYALLTNDGNNSVEQKAHRLAAAGLQVAQEAITSSGHVLREVGREQGLVDRLCFVAGRLGEPCYAESAGIRVTRRLEELEGCQGVIIGEEEYEWEPVIEELVNFFVAHPQAPLVVPNPDLYFPAGGGRLRVASGAVAALIATVLRAHGIRLRPLLLGKPYAPIFRHAHGRLEARSGRRLQRRRVLLAGDSLPADIRGASRFGYRTALLLTGVTTPETLARSRVLPDLVFPGIV